MFTKKNMTTNEVNHSLGPRSNNHQRGFPTTACRERRPPPPGRRKPRASRPEPASHHGVFMFTELGNDTYGLLFHAIRPGNSAISSRKLLHALMCVAALS